jgi:hypothetical protein
VARLQVSHSLRSIMVVSAGADHQQEEGPSEQSIAGAWQGRCDTMSDRQVVNPRQKRVKLHMLTQQHSVLKLVEPRTA